MDAQLLIFLLIAGVALVAAILVVTCRNPVHSALYLVVTFFCVAAVYVVLHAEFLAAVQVLVYAGGIMVLFLFVIFLVGPPRREGRWSIGGAQLAVSGLLALILAAVLGAYEVAARPWTPSATSGALAGGGGNLETVALALFRQYLLPFETVSVLLVVALVGAVVLARPGND